jgi:hypothetical protein
LKACVCCSELRMYSRKTRLRRVREGGKGSFSTGLGDLTEWRMYSRLRVNGNRFEEPTPICVALCSLSGKRWARKVAAIWTSRIEQGDGAGGGLPAEMEGVESR